MKRTVIVLVSIIFLLLCSWNTTFAQDFTSQCIIPGSFFSLRDSSLKGKFYNSEDLSEQLENILSRFDLQMRNDGVVFQKNTALMLVPECVESEPTPERACIDCDDPNQVAAGIGSCEWFLEGKTCALHIPFLVDITWSITKTYECVGALGSEVPADPYPVSELMSYLEVDGASCTHRAVNKNRSWVILIEVTGIANSNVCGHHIAGSKRVVECARGTQ